MSNARNDARDSGRGDARGRRYRLMWRWKTTGTTGSGPWMQRSDVLEAWLDSLSRRYNDMEHWIEEEPVRSGRAASEKHITRRSR